MPVIKIGHLRSEALFSGIRWEAVLSNLGIKFKRKGKDKYVILCPFHHDKTPSLTCYSDYPKRFKCYGCGADGSLTDFVIDILGIGISERDMERLGEILALRFKSRFNHLGQGQLFDLNDPDVPSIDI